MSSSTSRAWSDINKPTAFDTVSRMWPSSGISNQSFLEQQYEPFLEYANEEAAYMCRHSSQLAPPTLDMTLALIEDLRKNHDKARSELLEMARKRFMNIGDVVVLEYMELAARLWLTLNIHSQSSAVGPVHIHTNAIDWPDDQKLETLVQEHIKGRSGAPIDPYHSEIDENFTAAFLSNTCTIIICWTDNLADHLKFSKTQKQVKIYQHKVCLLHHFESTDEPVIPRDILEEALDTFELIFPYNDSATISLLTQHKKHFHRLGRCGRKRILDLEHYSYWGHRLSRLIRAFEEPPTGIRQLFKDKRNLKEWATVWIAVLVLILTVCSIVTGSVSTAVAIKQYNLAVAQACAQEELARKLVGFCT